MIRKASRLSTKIANIRNAFLRWKNRQQQRLSFKNMLADLLPQDSFLSRLMSAFRSDLKKGKSKSSFRFDARKPRVSARFEALEGRSMMAVLGAGDLAVVGYDTSGSPQDNFSIVALRELDAGTTFFVNDNEVSAAGGLAFTDLNEGEAQFTVKAGQTIPAGTVINLPWGAAAVSTSTYDWTATTGAGLGNANDELYFYNAASITATTATNFITFAQLGTSAGNVPAGLTLGTNAVDTTGAASRYKTTGATYSGSPAVLSSAINNATANWEAITTAQTTTLTPSNWTFTVSSTGTTTTTSLTSIAPLTVDQGGAVTFQGSIVAGSGAVTPTGTIEIRNGGATGTLLGSTTAIGGTGANGTFDFSSSTAPVGVYSNIRAYFVAGSGFQGSSSATDFGSALTVNAVGAATTTGLDSISPLTSSAGDAITFAGTVVAGSGAATPTGSIEIRNGGVAGTLLASTSTIGGTGVNGTFSITSTTVPVGNYSSIQAFYVPGAGFQASSSSTFGGSLNITPAGVTSLTAGDIAFTGIQSDDPDTFSFVLLKNVTSTTTLTFTDNGWGVGQAGFGNTTENTATVTFGSNYNAGTHFVVANNAGTATFQLVGTTTSAGTVTGVLNGLAAGGDSILAYQGTAPTTGSATNWVAGVSTNLWGSSSGTNLSALPTALTNGTNAIQLSTSATDVDNGAYNPTTFGGSVAQIRDSVNNIANWTTSDTAGPLSTTVFTVGTVATTASLDTVTPLAVNQGDSITFSGTIVAGSGTATPAGTIQIRNGGPTGTLLASTTTIGGTGVNGTFSFSSTAVPIGIYSNVQAFFVQGAGTDFLNSSSSVFGSTLTVNAVGATTTTTLGSVSPLLANVGEAVVFNGTIVAGSGTATPVGTVEIRNGGAAGTLLASTTTIGGTGANGTFSISSTTVPSGTFSAIQAFFVPGSGFVASNSSVFGSALTVASLVSYTTAGATYSQDFDSLPTSATANAALTGQVGSGPFVLTAAPWNGSAMGGWYASKLAGSGASLVSKIDDGSSSGGSLNIYGALSATERALGSVGSSTSVARFGAIIRNDTGATLNTFTLNYVGEQWRGGGNTSPAANTLDFGYQFGATNIDNGTFLPSTDLTFSSINLATTATAYDGNLAANRLAKSATISGFNWAPGQTLVIRWSDTDDAGQDDGLAVDDFTFTAAALANSAPVITSANSASFISGQAGTFTVTATAVPAATFTATGLPAWLTLNPTTGVLSGTAPTVTATTPINLVITATNGVAPNATQNFTLSVLPTVVSYEVVNSNYTQDFNGLPSTGSFTLPATGGPQQLQLAPINATNMPGWQFAVDTVASPTDTIKFFVDNGGSSTGGVYTYGTTGSSERSLGSASSGSNKPLYGAVLVNNTTQTLSQFTLSYTGEQWRRGSAAANVLDFSYAIGDNTTTVVNGTFVDANQLDFTAPNNQADPISVALDGNASGNKTAISGTVTGLTWAPGQTLVIRWKDVDDSGSDDGIAIDDLTFSANVFVATAPTITSRNSINFEAGISNSFTVTATGAPAPTFTAATLPAWLTLDANTGVLTGTPPAVTVATPITFTITAANGTAPNATQSFTLTSVPSTIAYATSGSSYSQNFDGLPNAGAFTLASTGPVNPELSPINANGISGWSFAKSSGTGTVARFTQDTGVVAAGSVYSYGANAGADRALGSVATSALISSFGSVFTNTSSETLTNFTVSYTGEQWRRGDSATANTLAFEYGLGATNLITGTFSPVTQLNFTSPNTSTTTTNVALDGNAVANQTAVTFNVTGIAWAPGQTLAIRWTDADDAGNDDGLAIDNLSFTASSAAGNVAPSVTTSSGSASFTGTTIAVDSGIVVADTDSTNLTGATVSITTAFVASEDVLGFVNANGITGSYNSATGVLALTGSATLANYQAALRSVTYNNTNATTSSTTRTISFQVNDGGSSNNLSNIATKGVVISLNAAPIVTASGGSTSFIGTALAIDASISVTDANSANLSGATISITTAFVASEDVLGFVNANGITGSYNSATGVLALTGSATLANYQAALRSVTYNNTNASPSTTSRVVSFQVNDGGAANNLSNVATKSVTVANTGNQPVSVSSVTSNRTGFTVQFSRPVDPAQINLYDATTNPLGATDVTLVGATSGAIRGSAVFNATNTALTFIKTGPTIATGATGAGAGTLSPDTYTLTLRSAANGFVDLGGNLLRDIGGSNAGNYVNTFTVSAPASNAVTLSLPDFARGFSQAVNVPNTATGIPVIISNANNIGGVDITINYNPALLTITGVTTPIAGASAIINTSTPGVAIIQVSSATAFATVDGAATIVNLIATVPANAPYAGKGIISFASMLVRDTNLAVVPSIADNAVHVAAFFADLNADQAYDSADSILVQRLGVGTNTGTTSFQTLDPFVVGDTLNDYSFDSADTITVQRLGVGTTVASVPALPAGAGGNVIYGADPELSIGTVTASSAATGTNVFVPINLLVTEASGITLGGMDFAISFDPTRFQINAGGVTIASSTQNGLIWDVDGNGDANPNLAGNPFSPPTINVDNVAGTVRIQSSSPEGTVLLPFGTTGTLLRVRFTIKAGAAAGTSAINLMQTVGTTSTRLRDNSLAALTLVPAPTNGADTIDGSITIPGVANSAPTALSLTPTSLAENAGANATIGTFTTTDPNAGNTFTYTLVSGTGSTDNADFNVSGNTLRANASFDFETKSSYSVRVRTTDQGGLFFEQSFTISITDVVENTAPTDIALSNTTIAENAGADATVGSLTTTDTAGDSHTYTLVSGTGADDNASFNISGSTLRATSSLDFETKSSYTVRVRTTDAGGLFFEKAFTISVTDVAENTAPTDIALSNSTVAENAGVDATVGSFTTTDTAGDTHIYTLVSGTGSDDNASFNISGGTLRATSSLDFETKSSYTVRVRTTDAGGLFFEKAFTISVTDVAENTAPTDIALSNSTVAENAGADATVGSFTTTDTAGDTHTYSLVSGTGSDDNASFNISGSTLRATSSLDFEAKSSYTVRVRTTDAGGLFFEKAFTISVTNVNEAPTIAPQTFSVAENSANGTAVGTVVAADVDANDTKTFAITAGNTSGAFAINATTGAITVANTTALDFETTPSFALTVSVTDAGSLSASNTVTINLTDVNEDPIYINEIYWNPQGTDAPNEYFELRGTPGATIANGTYLLGIEGDAGVPNPGDVQNIFDLSGRVFGSNGLILFLQKGATYNTTAAAAAGTTIVTNAGTGAGWGSGTSSSIGHSSDANATDLENGAVTYMLVRSSTAPALTDDIDSDDNGTPNGSVFAGWTVLDSIGALQSTALNDLTYAAVNIKNGTGPGTSATGPVTQIAGEVEYAARFAGANGMTAAAWLAGDAIGATPSFRLATSAANLTDGAYRGAALDHIGLPNNFTLVAPTDIALSATSVNENVAAGSTVGTFTTTDPTAGDTHTYTLVAGTGGTDNAAFTIVGNALNINAIPNFELKPSYAIRVRTTDAGSVTFEKEFTITVTDVNEAPSFGSASYTFSVPENSVTGTVVGTAGATDPDAGAVLVYSLSGPGSSNFAISSTGEITVAAGTSLDFETTNSYALIVGVSSEGGLTASASATINVTNVNEAPVFGAASYSFSIAENSAAATAVGSVSATDPDAPAPTLVYSLSGTGSSNFAIDSSGAITVAAGSTLNFETTPSFSLTVEVSDGALTTTAPLTISLTNVNEAPLFTPDTASFTVAENAANGVVVGTVAAVDPDAVDTLTYSITGGNGTGAGAFAINATTGQITVADTAQMSAQTYTVTVDATDALGLVDTITVTISVSANIAPSFGQASYTFSLAENSAAASAVGSVTATDPELATLTYSLTGTGASNFVINSATGAITVAAGATLDFEGTNSFSLTANVSDGFLSGTASVIINLTNVNEAPVFGAASYSFSVAENSAAATSVGSVSATDPDAATTLVYSLSGTGSSNFEISASGSITVAAGATLDFEATPSFSLIVTASDGTLSATAPVTISLTNVNETPVFGAASYSFSLTENSAAATAVGSVSATDPDAATTLVYSLSGTGSSNFAISASGAITVAAGATLDFETTPSYSLTVTASDGTLSATAPVTISLTNVNETPVFGAASYSFSVAENSAAATAVGSVSATDPDAATTLVYSLSGTGSANFAISASGAITVAAGATLNFETTPLFSLTVTASDGTLSATAPVTISLTNVNETPVFGAASYSFSLAENSAVATAVGSVSATDPDDATTLVYSLSGTGSSNFAISVSGAITVAAGATLNFESTPLFSLTVTASDGTLSATAPVTISLTNINEAPVFGAASYSFSVAENSPAATAVGSVSATDPDAATTLVYSLSGTGSSNFAISASGAISVAAGAILDFETTPSYSLTVTASDGTLSATAPVTISLTSVNEAPVLDGISYGASVAENSAAGTAVLGVSAVDPDAATTLVYSLSGTGSSNFAISATGAITVAAGATLNFETTPSYSLTVTASDGTLSATAPVTISVTNVNETPVFGAASYSFSVAENSAAATAVGSVSATDPDAATTLTYSLSGTGSSNFAISASGAITVAAGATLNFETTPSYSLTVTASDGTLSATAPVTISLTNVNETPVFGAASYSFSIAENSAAATAVGSVSAIDPDAATTLVYSLSGAGSSNFAISASGAITVAAGATLNFEATPSIVLTATASDGSLSATAPVTITLTDVNDAPTDILLSDNRIADTATAGTVVGTVSGVDQDAGSTFTFALSGIDAANFTLVGTSLQASAAYNGSQASYSIDIAVTDNGGLTFTKSFIINRVAGANQAPTNIILTGNTVAENSSIGTMLGAFQAVDPNPNNTFTFNLVPGAGSTNNSAFSINGSSLELASVPNFEANSSYSIRVRVTDQGGLSFDRIFTINVTNVNEAPTDINLSSSSVAINAPAGTVVGSLSTVDPDASSSFSYTLAGADASRFTIVGNSLRVGATALNGTTTSYSLSITSSDGSLTYTEAFTIGTVAAPNTAPTNILLSGNTIAENSAIGTLIGTLSATDDQATGHTFALVSGAGSTNNASFAISGTSLNLATIPNFEASSSYSARIRVTDGGGLSYDRIFTINITNVNEAPTDINLSGSTVAINAAAGTVVGALSTIDPDAGSVFSYSLSGTDASKFTIVGSSLRTAVALDGVQTSYSISITSSDGSLTYLEAFTIGTVAAPNSAPTNITLTTNSVPENTASGTPVGTLGAVDANQASGHTFAFASGAGSTDNASFAIVGTSLNLATVPNFEAKSSYSIRVRVTDAGGLTFEKVFSINVTNVNEAPTNVNLSNSTVAINAAAGTVVGNLSTVDPDSGNTFSYVVGGADASRFVVVGSSLRVGATALNGTTASYSITVTTTDQGGLTFTRAFTIGTASAPNTAPTNITLSSTNVVQNSAAGTLVGTLGAVDANQASGFTFALVAGAGSTDNATFTIVNGELRLNTSIPSRATKSSYVVRIRVTDNGGLSFDKIFGINVTL